MPIFLGAAFGIFLKYKRYKIGFWIFTILNILVGYWFIFVLEDTWHLRIPEDGDQRFRAIVIAIPG